jgi:hypothetical protein
MPTNTPTLTLDCPDCDGNGWFASGLTDTPVQVQCERCHGTGKLAVNRRRPICTRTAYADEGTARRAAEHRRKDGKAHEVKKAQYYCAECRMWHNRKI